MGDKSPKNKEKKKKKQVKKQNQRTTEETSDRFFYHQQELGATPGLSARAGSTSREPCGCL